MQDIRELDPKIVMELVQQFYGVGEHYRAGKLDKVSVLELLNALAIFTGVILTATDRDGFRFFTTAVNNTIKDVPTFLPEGKCLNLTIETIERD